MKKSFQKTIIDSAAIAILITIASVLPVSASSRSVENRVNSNNYTALAEDLMYIQAMSYCQKGGKTSTDGKWAETIDFSNSPSSTTNQRKWLGDIINARIKSDGTMIYSSYLEHVSKDSGKGDSYFKCEDLTSTGNFQWADLFRRFNLYYTSYVKKVLCGTNGTDGIVKFRIGFDLRADGNTTNWPEGFPSPDELTNDGYPKTLEACNRIYDKLWNGDFINSAQLAKNGSNKNFQVRFDIVRNSFLGNSNIYSAVNFDGFETYSNEIDNANKYLAVTQSGLCDASRIDKSEYDSNSSAINYYRFFVNGGYEYWKVKKDDEVSVGFSSSNNKRKCYAVAEELEEASPSLIDSTRETAIESCLQSYTDGLAVLENLLENWQTIYNEAWRVIRFAQAASTGDYTYITLENYNVYKNNTVVNKVANYSAVLSVAQKTLDVFKQAAVTAGRDWDGLDGVSGVTREDWEELESAANELHTLLSDVETKIEEARALRPSENAHRDGESVRDSVEGFYSFESEDGSRLSCELSDLLDDKLGEIGDLVGGEINYTTYDESSQGDQIDGGGTVSSTTACTSVAGSMGWILCPVMNFLNSTISWFFEAIIEPSMILDIQLLDRNSGTYTAWQIFRDFANIVFVIFFLIVIFSQVTGFGIDNYGIKKALPKIIVGAILVNLSFIICQLAVDLSNIFGKGINELLSNISISVPQEFIDANGLEGNVFVKGGILLALVGGLVAGGFWLKHAGLMGSAVSALLFPILSVIASAFIAFVLLVFFLSLRQAMVVILVVMSPMAFVCYMLPNTKKLFDKWLTVFKAMLILYPTCALMMSGGRLASRILLSSGGAAENLFLLLIACVAELGPIFFIPTVARGAFQGMGMIGARLTGFASRFPGGMRRRISHSKAAQARSKQFHNKLDAKRIQDLQNSEERIKNNKGTLLDKYRTRSTAANRERIAELRKNQIANAQHEQELEQWNGENGQALVQANIEKAKFDAATSEKGTLQWNNEDYRKGKENQAELNLRNDSKTTTLYARDEYRQSREKQQDAALSNETTRMYADQFSQLDISGLEDALRNAINGATTDRTEQFSAAFNALVQAGQTDKAREVIIRNAGDFQALMTSDEDFRTKATQQFGASGNFIMQEYAKHVGQNRGSAKSFDKWVNDQDDQSLRASIQAKGLDHMDKDDFAFLAEHKEALSGASADNISKVAAYTSDTATIAKLTQAIEQLEPAVRESVIAHTSADRFASMDQGIRDALAGKHASMGNGSYGIGPNDSLWRDQVGTAIRDNPQIASRIETTVRSRYAADPEPTPTPTPAPTPAPAPTSSPTHSQTHPVHIYGASGNDILSTVDAPERPTEFTDTFNQRRDASGRLIDETDGRNHRRRAR